MSFSSYDVDRRTKSARFYDQMNILVDWKKIERKINKYYQKGETLKGEKPYSGLVLFKMLLIGMWNKLSDVRLEEHVNDSLSATKFCGLQLEDQVPDNSTISRFRTLLCEKKAFDRLLEVVNDELEKHHLIINEGIKVDASLTDSPFRPRGKKTYQVAEDRKEDQLPESEKQKQEDSIREIVSDGVDKEARFLSKRGKPHYGYKKQIAVDGDGMVLSVHTTAANEHDSKGLQPLLEKTKREYLKKGVSTDKGYKTPSNDAYLKQKRIKNRIQDKAYRNRPLTDWQVKRNKLIAKSRWVVERTFGDQVIWFGAGKTRYKGLAKIHAQHVMEAICHNLKRSPKLVLLRAV